MSIRPNSFSMAATTARIPFPSVTSNRQDFVVAPVFSWISAAASATFCSWMSVRTTTAPSAARLVAIPLPMPWAAPVTSATFPSSNMSNLQDLNVRGLTVELAASNIRGLITSRGRARLATLLAQGL